MKMTSTQVVETSVTNNSPFQDYTHSDDHNRRTTDTPGFKPFTINYYSQPAAGTEGKRAVGRPKTTWRRIVEVERRQAGWNDWSTARAVARDRMEWKQNVTGAKSDDDDYELQEQWLSVYHVLSFLLAANLREDPNQPLNPHPELGKYFKGFTGTRYTPNECLQQEYPGDMDIWIKQDYIQHWNTIHTFIEYTFKPLLTADTSNRWTPLVSGHLGRVLLGSTALGWLFFFVFYWEKNVFSWFGWSTFSTELKLGSVETAGKVFYWETSTMST